MTDTPRNALFWPILTILAVTLWRVAALSLNQVDLFMDEAQYWLWGQEPAFGHYSKPPLIGWAIRASVELGGSDAPFWVRLPGPISYGIAGVLVSLLAMRVWPARAAAWAGAVFVSLPGISVLQQFISTDDLLFPFVALALLAWFRLAERPNTGWALTLGAAVGLGMMAKYAMIYLVGLVPLALLLGQGRQIPARHFGLAAIVAALIFAPNIWWNVANGFITVSHTAENAGWQGIDLNWSGAAEFLGTQFAAFFPIFGVAYILAALRPREGGRNARYLLLFSLTIFLAVTVQALIRDANGNWAAPAFVAGTALAAPWLYLASRTWFRAGLALNLAFAALLPLTMLNPEMWVIRGEQVFARTMGVRALSEAALDTARAEGLTAIAASDRKILADLAYRSKGTGISVYAYPVSEPPDSHYALTRPLTAAAGPALYVGKTAPAPCGALPEIRRWEGEAGTDRIRNLVFLRLDGPCQLN